MIQAIQKNITTQWWNAVFVLCARKGSVLEEDDGRVQELRAQLKHFLSGGPTAPSALEMPPTLSARDRLIVHEVK